MQAPKVSNFSSSSAMAQLNALIANKKEKDSKGKGEVVTGLNERTRVIPASMSHQISIKDEDKLSPEQARALRAALSGKNICITGPAGTGKSHIVKIIKEHFEEKKMNVALTSSSGKSAVNIGGKTIHSWSGIHLCQSKETAIRNVLKYKNPQYNINSTHVLVIDEISMVSGLLLDILDYVFRIVRNCNSAFGGIQVIMVGDFYQLAPVKAAKYAFESDYWDQYVQEVIELKQVFRQQNAQFVKVLNKIRKGEVDDEVIDTFEPCIGREYEGLIKPTQLYPVNEMVDMMNEDELFKLQSEDNPIESFDATDDVPKQAKSRYTPSAKAKEEALARLDKECRAPKELLLCKNAQVMLLKNLNVQAGLANGSRGVIIGYNNHGWPKVKFLNGQEVDIAPEKWRVRYSKDVVAERIQFPLTLAWAMSIHKSQGITVDLARVDLGDRIFGDGMIYVALSRCRSLEGLQIDSINWNLVNVSRRVKRFYEKYCPE